MYYTYDVRTCIVCHKQPCFEGHFTIETMSINGNIIIRERHRDL